MTRAEDPWITAGGSGLTSALLLPFCLRTRPGRQQLQSTTDKLKTMAVKRESMRQQSFKQAADGSGPQPLAAAVGPGAPTLHEGVEEGE